MYIRVADTGLSSIHRIGTVEHGFRCQPGDSRRWHASRKHKHAGSSKLATFDVPARNKKTANGDKKSRASILMTPTSGGNDGIATIDGTSGTWLEIDTAADRRLRNGDAWWYFEDLSTGGAEMSLTCRLASLPIWRSFAWHVNRVCEFYDFPRLMEVSILWIVNPLWITRWTFLEKVLNIVTSILGYCADRYACFVH